MTRIVERSSTPQKPNFWQRLAFQYRWMSTRNKIALWAILMAIVIGIFSLQYVRPTYRIARMWIYIHLAEKLTAKKDYNAASLALRKALHSGAEYPDSWKALASFMEQIGAPDIINVWERLAVMEPQNREYRYKQIAAAIRFGRGYDAEMVLKQIPAEWHGDADYLRQEAALAMTRNDNETAERDLAQLLKVLPNDEQAKFDLAAVRSTSSSDAVRADARDELMEIAGKGGAFSVAAFRQLISLAVKDQDLAEADRLSTRLIELPQVSIRDRLLHLQLELATNSWSAGASLQNLRAYLEAHPQDFTPAMEWMLSVKLDPAGTRRWVESLPADFVRNPDVQTGLLEYYLNVPDLDQAFRILRARQDDFQLSSNVLDLAQQALTQYQADDGGDAEQTWMRVIYATEGNARALQFLSLLASTQGWTGATGRALTALTDAAPMQAGAWGLLVQHERSVGNLAGLYSALGGLLKINPYDKNVGSEWVITSILLRKGDSRQALKVAENAYNSASPAEAAVGTAYAMELVENNRPGEALAVIEQMSEVDRREPSRAIYIGAVLAANKRNAEALDYFKRAEGFNNFHFAEEKTFLRIWKGIAMGEATTEQEAEQSLVQSVDVQAEADRIRKQFEQQLRDRRDPAEAQRIFDSLKKDMENRKTVSPEVQEILRQAREENAKTPPLTPR
jgi:predicted Zn-dependent protease